MNFAFWPETAESVAILAGRSQARICLWLSTALPLMLDTSAIHDNILPYHQLTSALTSAFFSTDSKVVVLVKYVSESGPFCLS